MRTLLLGGTSEAVALARELDDIVYACTTDYGQRIAREHGITDTAGAMNGDEMVSFIGDHDIEIVIDATHPFAREASINAMRAAEVSGIPYIRYEPPSKVPEDVLTFLSQEEAAEYLVSTQEKILLTTGSKELEAWGSIDRERLVIRVLPRSEVLVKCEALGYTPGQIIAQMGPFTREENLAQIRRYGIDVLVTKETSAGGMDEKCTAAREAGIEIIIITRPTLDYLERRETIGEVKERLEGLS